MGLEGLGRLLTGIGNGLSGTAVDSHHGAPGRPHTPGCAQSTYQNVDKMETMYAPTSLSVEASTFIDDVCPMTYDVESESTFVRLGDTNATLALHCSDQALINLAKTALRAVDAMMRRRGQPVPSWADCSP